MNNDLKERFINVVAGKVAAMVMGGTSGPVFDMEQATLFIEHAEQGPFNGFKLIEELMHRTLDIIKATGGSEQQGIIAVMNINTSAVVCLSTKVARDAAQRAQESGDGDAMQNFLADAIKDILGENLQSESVTPPELDKATKDSMFDGLGFNMKWDDNIPPTAP